MRHARPGCSAGYAAAKTDAHRRPSLKLGDGELSLAVPIDARPCILYPPSRFDAAACPPDAEAATSPPSVGTGTRWVAALASVLFPDVGPGAGATISITVHDVYRGYEPFPAAAQAFSRSAFDPFIANTPGARPMGGGPTATLLSVGDLVIVRATLDLEGAARPLLAHMLAYAATAEHGIYMILMNTTRESSGAMDVLARRVGATIRLLHPAPPAPIEAQ